MATATDTRTREPVAPELRKLASGRSCRNVGTSRGRPSRLRTSTGLLCGHHRDRASDATVARYYDPRTAQFLTRDPEQSVTRAAFSYANEDPLDRTDPLGLDDGYNVDPNVRALFQQYLGWYHHGLGPISWFENGGLKVAPCDIARVTIAIVERIWLDQYRSQQGLSLSDSIDDIEGGA